jgi:diguanylate cyclase
VHSDQAMSRTDRTLALLGDIDGALASGDVFVLYQPKYDLGKARIAGAEALVRWRHPVLGAVSPDEFIPLLENSGHIAPLTFTVLDRCIADLEAWSAGGHDLGVSVNISAALLDDRAFTDALTLRLASIGPLAARITLEITESATLDGAASAIAALEAIRAHGTRISIDDYGTGRATLSYLKSFPTDEIKIDKSFVTAIESSASDRILVRSTIELAHELGFAVVAEGVEDIACLDLLRSYQCDLAQGWAIGRPMPAADLLVRAAASAPAPITALRAAASPSIVTLRDR